MKKIKKKFPYFLFSSVTPLIVLTSISCSKSDNENEIDTELNFEINTEIISSRNSFEENKDNYEEMKKIFIFNNNTQINWNWNIEEIKVINISDEKVKFEARFKLFNYENNLEKIISNKFDLSFYNNEIYLDRSYSEMANSISLKKEYENEKIANLFFDEQTKTNNQFVEKYIDVDRISQNCLGLYVDLEIPSQTLNINNNDNYFRFKLNLFETSNREPIDLTQTSATPYLNNIKQNQKSTFTIINQDDLSKTNINFVSNDNLGQLFFRINNDQQVQEMIEINYSFNNKTIIGSLDFSSYLNIRFSNNNQFANNLITEIKFNQNSQITLANNVFKNNKIKEVHLPNNVENFNKNCFDDTTKIYNLRNIPITNEIIDNENNLRLDLIDDQNKFEEAFFIIKKQLEINNIKFKNIYLPNLENLIFLNQKDYAYNLNLKAEYLIFKDNDNDQDYSSISKLFKKWEIDNINIPDYIYKIKKDTFKITSTTSITREFNEKTLNLINNNQLTINNNTYLPNESTSSIINKMDKLDDYFYSFNSNPLEINKIIFNDLEITINSIDFDNWKFFTDRNSATKEIIFNNNVNTINIDLYNKIKEFVDKNNDITLTREKFLSNEILDSSGVLYLEKLYNQYTNANSNYLSGYENYINEINLNNVSTIKNSTFKSLKWNDMNIVLNSNIEEIEREALKDFGGTIDVNDFSPLIIKESGFQNTKIKGNLNFVRLTLVEQNAFKDLKSENEEGFDVQNVNIKNIPEYLFQSSWIKSISFNSISDISINKYAFQSCTKLTNVNLSNVISIGDNVFSGCTKLTNVDLSNVNSIGNNAFSGCNNLTGDIILNKNIIRLGDNIFQNCHKINNIINFNVNEFTFKQLFGDNTNPKPNITINDESLINQEIGYDNESNILDLRNFDFGSKTKINYLNIFTNKKRKEQNNVIEKLILPENDTINTNLQYVFSGITIKELVWNSNRKEVNNKLLKNLFNGATINRLNDDFFKNMQIIPNDFLNQTSLENRSFNLDGVNKIGNNVFKDLNEIEFLNTENVKEIGNNSFKNNCIFKIGQDVKLKEDSFGINTYQIINNNSNITREKIFSLNSPFNRIYNQNTKILDFSWLTENEVNNQIYSNISEYLLNNDIDKLILPKIPILNSSNSLFTNLGEINIMEFQIENSAINSGAFQGTNIINKPQKDQTNIVVDLDNFFDLAIN